MKKYHVKIVLVILICLSSILGSQALADGIKQRMLHRQPILLDLKDRGIIGETSTGYLGFVTPRREGEPVVKAENADRRAIYAHIASQQKLSVDLVGRRRALQLIERAPHGHFFQNKRGVWVRK